MVSRRVTHRVVPRNAPYPKPRGSPMITTVYDTPLDPVIGESFEAFLARVVACPGTTVFSITRGEYEGWSE